MDKIKQILGSERALLTVNSDNFTKINLENSSKALPLGDINKIVNVGQQFDIERQKCTYYRIIGSINPTISNVLFNLTDNTLNNAYTWSGFNDISFLDTSYPKDNNLSDKEDFNFKQSINKNLIEKNGWFGYINPDITKAGLCNFIDVEPKRERFSFIPDNKPFHTINSNSVKNWELTITYPKTIDSEHYIVKGGLLIIDNQQAIVSTRNMTALGVSCRHNLKVGDTVKITGTNGLNGENVIIRTGLDNGDLKDYYFVIDKQFNPISIGADSRFKRVFGGVESEYYFRKFGKIKTKNNPKIETDDYEVYNQAFGENIYSDPIVQYVFNEDIDVSDLIDNLNRPLSEIYLTIIKTDSNDLFTKIMSGIEIPFIPKLNTSDINPYLLNVPLINKINSSNESHIPLEDNLTINSDEFYGDLVEYNKNEVLETVLCEVSHRFNTNNRETISNFSYVNIIGTQPTLTNINLGPRQEGYFYKAHYGFKIREYSNYVEQGDENTIDKPTYAINNGDGRYFWRDLLPIGFNDVNEKTLNYPFLNNSHYLYGNHVFFLKRQDPFGYWNILHLDFPSDSFGESSTINKFITNSNEDAC